MTDVTPSLALKPPGFLTAPRGLVRTPAGERLAAPGSNGGRLCFAALERRGLQVGGTTATWNL